MRRVLIFMPIFYCLIALETSYSRFANLLGDNMEDWNAKPCIFMSVHSNCPHLTTHSMFQRLLCPCWGPGMISSYHNGLYACST